MAVVIVVVVVVVVVVLLRSVRLQFALEMETSSRSVPLKMHKTVALSLYSNPFNSFGVRRKHCGVDGSDAESTICLNTFRSFFGSIPWLISSTTRNGHFVRFWSDMRYNIVMSSVRHQIVYSYRARVMVHLLGT